MGRETGRQGESLQDGERERLGDRDWHGESRGDIERYFETGIEGKIYYHVDN